MKILLLIVGVLISFSSCLDYSKEKSFGDGTKEQVVNETSLENYESSNLELVPLEIIDDKLQYDFYKTEMSTGYFDYSSVEVIIAIPRTNDKKIIKLESPVFTSINANFSALFEDLKFESHKELEMGLVEIAELFSSATYNSTVKKLSKNQSQVIFELWTGNQLWRHMLFNISENSLIEMKISNPLKKI